MRLPRTIRVGALRYRVISNRDAMNAVCREQSSDLLGSTDAVKLIITLEPTQAPDQLADTLLHEVLHTLTDVSGLQSEWGAEKDESVVRRLTPHLLALLRQNPTLVTYLTTEVPDAEPDQVGRKQRRNS